MTHRVPEDQYKAIMRRNGARGGTVSAERKAALARATEKPPAPREDVPAGSRRLGLDGWTTKRRGPSD